MEQENLQIRYSDADLAEFKAIIVKKIEKAQNDLDLIKSAYMNDLNNGTDDTSPTFKAFEEGSETMSKEANSALAIRQEKFIRDLKNALVRIENKTYGVCRVTGKLIEKEGMAWGVELPGNYGKLILTIFRIFAVGGIFWWLKDAIAKKGSAVLIISISLILAGALGNIIDSVFYGVIFNDSRMEVATIFSNQPYGTWFHGKVVDMFYFPIWKGYLPEWLPFWGGKYFTFFNAIFNVADAAISVGVALLILFNKRIFKD